MLKHCCDTMTQKVNHVCKSHADPFECPDNIIFFEPQFNEYGIIIHDGGSSYSLISYCPWCGSKLPESRRDLWFDTLESLGFDDPFSQVIPEEFTTDAWYRR